MSEPEKHVHVNLEGRKFRLVHEEYGWMYWQEKPFKKRPWVKLTDSKLIKALYQELNKRMLNQKMRRMIDARPSE